MILLPTYVQKYIIKILCEYINWNNSFIDYIENKAVYKGEDYRNNEKEIKKLLLSIAMISKELFKTVSNNISVSVDFNYTNSKWSIVKQDNIKTLKLHYNHKPEINYMYYMKQKDQLQEIPITTVNEKIQYMLSSPTNVFNELIIRNIRSNSDEQIISLVNSIDFDNLYIHELFINEETTMKTLDKLKNVKRLFYLVVNGCNDKQVLQHVFKKWNSSLIQLSVETNDTTENYFKLFQMLTETTNLVENIEFLQYSDRNSTLVDLVCVMKHCKNVADIHLSLCFENWVYFLSTEKEREKLSLSRCFCNSIIKKTVHINGINSSVKDVINGEIEEQKEFNENWLLLKQLFKENKSLKHIGIYCGCSGFIWDKSKQLPETYVNEIASLISSNSSILILSMWSSITAQIFEKILENNKTITTYEFGEINDSSYDFDDIVSKYKSLVTNESNQHIESFQFFKKKFNHTDITFDDIVLYEYKK